MNFRGFQAFMLDILFTKTSCLLKIKQNKFSLFKNYTLSNLFLVETFKNLN